MKRTIAIFVSLIILAIMLLPNNSNAALGGGLVKISTDADTIEVGDTVKVKVTQYETGGGALKNTKYVKFTLSYDKDIFSYQSIEEELDVSDSEGTITVTSTQPHQDADISSATLIFKSKKATTGKGANFKVSEFKSGDEEGTAIAGNYSVMQLNVIVKERYEGVVSIQADKTSVPAERKVNISLAQSIATNYVEATISYDKNHFEFIAPANSEYEADTSTDGQVTVKASGTDLKDVTLLFKGIAETEGNSPSRFRIINYKAGNNSEEALNAHLYSAQEVSVAVTPRDQSTVQIKTDLTNDIATIGDTFIVTVSQDKPTDYLQFDLFYNKEIFAYVGLGDNNAEVTATEQDDLLNISATGSQISEINLKFQALKLTEGINETNKENIKVSNFLSGENSGDTDEALYDIQQVGIQVVAEPIIDQPEQPAEQPTEKPAEPSAQQVEELPDTGSIVTTLIAVIIAGITILAIAIRKYIISKKS